MERALHVVDVTCESQSIGPVVGTWSRIQSLGVCERLLACERPTSLNQHRGYLAFNRLLQRLKGLNE